MASVRGGRCLRDFSVARMLAAEIRPSHQRSTIDDLREQSARLGERERTVLGLVALGFDGTEVAARLGITARTFDTHMQRTSSRAVSGIVPST